MCFVYAPKLSQEFGTLKLMLKGVHDGCIDLVARLLVAC
jgi:hypothetical protein